MVATRFGDGEHTRPACCFWRLAKKSWEIVLLFQSDWHLDIRAQRSFRRAAGMDSRADCGPLYSPVKSTHTGEVQPMFPSTCSMRR